MSHLPFEKSLETDRERLVSHPLFARVVGLPELRVFMETHVFAVWDFMCLLKSLQGALTGVTVPWLPPVSREAARFVNEIVLGEETDEVEPGIYMSHFELYLEAMRDCGADTGPICRFLELVRDDRGIPEALDESGAPLGARSFVLATMRFCALRPHEAAAAFLYGREDLIPAMFRRILADANALGLVECTRIRLYLERHIEIDSDSHGPMARRLMDCLCGDDTKKWQEAAFVASSALAERLHLWDQVLANLTTCGSLGREGGPKAVVVSHSPRVRASRAST